jgi:hypothetical protein
MRGLITLTVIVFLCYFCWHYLPEQMKTALREFRGTHLFKVVALFLLIWLAFMTQATFGSGKIF